MAMHWSYFKLEFLGEPEEDPEAHILQMIRWVDTHNFAAGQRVQRFPLTLAGESRLWNQFMHLFPGIWEELWEKFRTQFSKINNTREQLFYALRSFPFD